MDELFDQMLIDKYGVNYDQLLERLDRDIEEH